MSARVSAKSRKLFAFFLFFFLCWIDTAFSQVITTIAGNGSLAGNDSLASNASIPYPTGVCVDTKGNLFIATSERVKKVAANTGVITTFAGTGIAGSSGDGGFAFDARLHSPIGICSDKEGNVFIAEYNGHRVRKVSTSGVITTVAGTGVSGYNGDDRQAITAQLSSPWGIATDNQHNLYIADLYNHRIRKLNLTTGIIQTIAGSGISLSKGDGGAAAKAMVASPSGIAVDNDGNIYFTESAWSISSRVRRIDAVTGIISTVAGSNVFGYSGEGGPAAKATLFAPTGLVVDNKNNIYISEYNDSRIRRIDSRTGIITTIAGKGTQSFCCDGGPATEALLNNPMGIAVDAAGDLFVADNSNHRVRKITPLCTTPEISITASSALYCYNASPSFTATVSGIVTNAVYQWKKNGVSIGGNTSSAVVPVAINDVITCELTGANDCSNAFSVLSNSIAIQSNPGYNQGPEVSIATDKESFCAGALVSFTATNVSGSATPAYRWLVNGAEAGTNSTVFTTDSLANGDKVECVMTVPHCGQNGGTTKDYSNAITVHVYPLPNLHFNPSRLQIERGQQAELTPSVQGNVLQHRWSPANMLVNPSSLSVQTSSLLATTSYHLWVQTTGGCEDTASIVVAVDGKLFLPNSFTPNGDGKNDVFRIPPTAGFQLKTFSIFDRWGNKVFTTTAIENGWDGKRNGALLAPGAYIYFITGKDDKSDVVLKGTVQLIR